MPDINSKGIQSLAPGTGGVSTLTIPAGATKAYITVETNSVRYWTNGTAPTSTTGHLVPVGGSFTLDTQGQLANFKVIAITAASSLQISYF